MKTAGSRNSQAIRTENFALSSESTIQKIFRDVKLGKGVLSSPKGTNMTAQGEGPIRSGKIGAKPWVKSCAVPKTPKG